MTQRANTPKQKQEVIERLLKVWLKNPNMRLPQLIGNVYHIPSGADPYHVEDYPFVETIEDFYIENPIS